MSAACADADSGADAPTTTTIEATTTADVPSATHEIDNALPREVTVNGETYFTDDPNETNIYFMSNWAERNGSIFYKSPDQQEALEDEFEALFGAAYARIENVTIRHEYDGPLEEPRVIVEYDASRQPELAPEILTQVKANIFRVDWHYESGNIGGGSGFFLRDSERQITRGYGSAHR